MITGVRATFVPAGRTENHLDAGKRQPAERAFLAVIVLTNAAMTLADSIAHASTSFAFCCSGWKFPRSGMSHFSQTMLF